MILLSKIWSSSDDQRILSSHVNVKKIYWEKNGSSFFFIKLFPSTMLLKVVTDFNTLSVFPLSGILWIFAAICTQFGAVCGTGHSPQSRNFLMVDI